MLNVKELREEFSRLHGEANEIIEAAAAANRELKDEEKTANETRFARMTAIKNALEEQARFAALTLADDQGGNDNGAEGEGKGTVETPRDPAGRDEFNAAEGKSRHVAIEGKKIDRAKFAKAMIDWAVTGVMATQFATITTATASGALLPRLIGEPLVPTSANVFREALAIYGMKPVETATTADLTIPVVGTAAGGEVAQNASSETENEPTLTGSIVLNVKTYQSGSAWFSNQQLAATDFDLVTYIQTDLSYAKELGFESAMVAAIIANASITQEVATATTTGFTYANLVDLNNKLPKRYQRSKVIILSATAFAAAEKLVGDDGHPVLVKDPQNEGLMRFNGTPVLRSDYLEAFGASKVVGVVVSMMGFRLRDVTQQNLERYRQSSKPNQTGFNLFAYHGYGYDVAAVAKLKTPAS